MRILQVVGYKNSGKTTLSSELIRVFSNQGLKVGSLKHHGHGGIPKLADGTDSEKHRKSGAILAGVEGDSVFQLTMTDHSMELEQLLAFYQLLDLDLLIIEGYKAASFDKVVLLRGEEDLALLDQLSNIRAVISSVPIHKSPISYAVFSSSNHQNFIEWTKQFLLSKW